MLGLAAIVYVLARPALSARMPYLSILEFPMGALVVALVITAGLRRQKPMPARSWRKHAQVVRLLPDPALAPHLGALERWLETGEGVDAAADVVARAATNDPHQQAQMRTRLTADMRLKVTRRKREALLDQQIEGV